MQAIEANRSERGNKWPRAGSRSRGMQLNRYYLGTPMRLAMKNGTARVTTQTIQTKTRSALANTSQSFVLCRIAYIYICITKQDQSLSSPRANPSSKSSRGFARSVSKIIFTMHSVRKKTGGLGDPCFLCGCNNARHSVHLRVTLSPQQNVTSSFHKRIPRDCKLRARPPALHSSLSVYRAPCFVRRKRSYK